MPTLAQAEAALVGPAPDAGAGLVGGLLKQVGYDVTGESPVASLATAISAALLACGVTPDDVIAPDDEDMERLASKDWLKFLDIASLVLLESASGSASGAGGLKRRKYEDYEAEYFEAGVDLAGILASKRDYVRRRWGWGAAQLYAGTIRVKSGANCSEF